jgi:hypothetical protein
VLGPDPPPRSLNERLPAPYVVTSHLLPVDPKTVSDPCATTMIAPPDVNASRNGRPEELRICAMAMSVPAKRNRSVRVVCPPRQGSVRKDWRWGRRGGSRRHTGACHHGHRDYRLSHLARHLTLLKVRPASDRASKSGTGCCSIDWYKLKRENKATPVMEFEIIFVLSWLVAA